MGYRKICFIVRSLILLFKEIARNKENILFY